MMQRGMTYEEAKSLSPGDAVEVFQPSEDEHGNVGPGGEWHPAQVLPGGVRECNPNDGRGPRIIVDVRFSEKRTRTDYCTVYVCDHPVRIGPEIRFPDSDPLLEACEAVLKYEDHEFKTSNAAQASALQKQLDEMKAEGNALRSLTNTLGIITSISEDGEWLLQLSEMIRRHVEKNKPAAVEKHQVFVADVALHTDAVSYGDPQSKNEVEYANYSRQRYKGEGTLNFPESDRRLVVNFISFGINGKVIGGIPTRAIHLAEGIAPAVHTSLSPNW